MSKKAATLLGAVVLLTGAVISDAAPAQGAKGEQRQAEPLTKQEQTKARDEQQGRAPGVGEARTGQARGMAKGEGRQTAEDMQARREERKEIQEGYREGRQEGEVAKAKKKPWWKFWGSDEQR